MKTIKHAKHRLDLVKIKHPLRPNLASDSTSLQQPALRRHVWSAVLCGALAIPGTMFYSDEGPHHLTCSGYAPAATSFEAGRTLTTKPVFMTVSYTCWGTNALTAAVLKPFGKDGQCSLSVNGKPSVEANWHSNMIVASNREATEYNSSTGIMTAAIPRHAEVLGSARALVASCKNQWF